MDDVMRAETKKNTRWKEDLFFTVKLALQKLPKYYLAVTQTIDMFFISARMVDPFWKLRSSRKWGKLMDINFQDMTSYTTQYH
jgi:hypothetical protein